ncbi:MAG: glycogen synthase GlgA [candidate division KSB1 bacterium]|nr:glycogen synthase GlgA [candidate division KSB1 bacterium]
MKNVYNILYVSPEVAPFAKTGGLADVAGALPKALKEMGHDIRIMMPKYGCISERKYVLREVIRLREIPVRLGQRQYVVSAKSAFLPDAKVQVYFVDYPPYFDRDSLYVNPSTGQDWSDNPERFALFCRAVIEVLKVLHWQPDVIHCNDWQTALIPAYLKTRLQGDPFFAKVSTLLTIHNLAYQGVFDASVAEVIDLPPELFQPGGPLEFYGKVNFLKAGIVYADAISTVSEKYAEEIQTEEFGAGLDGVLRQRAADIHGILNGVDYTVWNPETDEFIPHKYSASDLSGKLRDKEALLTHVGLAFRPDVPVIGMISRLAEQKGFDILAEAMDSILAMDVQMVLLGTGDPKYHKIFEKFAKKYPSKLSVNLRFDEPLAHLIEAGSDMFLMPSRYEPCGLNQIYSLRYGTIPIVRATGGLADTIQDFDPETGRGNGFVFQEYSAAALLDAIGRALKVYQDRTTWTKLVKNAMRQDFSWQASARKYVALYKKLITSR